MASDDNHAENGDRKEHQVHRTPKKPKLISQTCITQREILDEFWHHDRSVARINNGSFGCCPASIQAAQRRWQLEFLRQPDRFYFRQLRPAIDRSRSLILPLINASHLDEISLVDNATTATAIVLQHISRAFHDNRYQKGDAAIILHYAYGAVKKSVQAYVSSAGGYVIEVPLPFPVYSNDEVVAEFKNAFNKAKSENKRVRFAIIDHITSMPSVILPVKELVKICRDEGVDQVFIDAAHAIGCIKVDVKDIGADFYSSNLHKWMFCPPSVAFLYCRNFQDSGDDVHHPVVSHEYGNGLPIESAWIGTRDYSSQLVVAEALDFMNRFAGGMEDIMKTNHDKVVEMGQMLADAWGTHIGCPPEMCASMIMVGLPACLEIESEEHSLRLRSHLRDVFNVEVPIYYRPPKEGESGCLTGYARISHQVYNTEQDYHSFREAVIQLVQNGFTCKELTDAGGDSPEEISASPLNPPSSCVEVSS